MSFRKTSLPPLPWPERLGGEVDQHGTGEGVGDHQGRRGQVVGAHVRVDPALEVAVAGEHRDRDEVAALDRFADRLGEGAGVADAGGAAVADEVEAESVQRLGQAGLVQVVGDDLRAGRQRCLHPRLRLQPLGHRVLRQQAGGDQNARVGGVGAGGDRGDHHVAVADVVAVAGDLDAGLARLAVLAELALEGFAEARRGVRQEDPVLRTLRPGEGGQHRRQVEFEGLGEHRLFHAGLDPEALLLGVGLDQGDAFRRRGPWRRGS